RALRQTGLRVARLPCMVRKPDDHPAHGVRLCRKGHCRLEFPGKSKFKLTMDARGHVRFSQVPKIRIASMIEHSRQLGERRTFRASFNCRFEIIRAVASRVVHSYAFLLVSETPHLFPLSLSAIDGWRRAAFAWR